MSRAEFAVVLQPLVSAMRADFDTAAWTAYYRALEDVSPALLEAAVDKLIREPLEFFPKAGELRAECERQRLAILAAHPYDGCASCEEHGKGWEPVMVNGVQRMARCACYGRHMERLALLGVGDVPALPPAMESRAPEPEDLSPEVRSQLIAAIRDKVMR
jgi:hypothetical protein